MMPVHALCHITQRNRRHIVIDSGNNPSKHKIRKMGKNKSINLTKRFLRKGETAKFIYI